MNKEQAKAEMIEVFQALGVEVEIRDEEVSGEDYEYGFSLEKGRVFINRGGIYRFQSNKVYPGWHVYAIQDQELVEIDKGEGPSLPLACLAAVEVILAARLDNWMDKKICEEMEAIEKDAEEYWKNYK